MRVIEGQNNISTLLQMYKVVSNAVEIETRGQKCREIRNLAVVFDGRQAICTNFEAREFNLTYAKKEWLWYLGADPKDHSIVEHAKAWKKLQQEDGTFYSNYGQYIFGEQHLGKPTQLAYVLKTLSEDKNSRRASIVLLKQEHLFADNSDVVCTYGINFHITDDVLSMTVMMRSNDVIWGFTNDAFCFSQLHMFVLKLLQKVYPNLKAGTYTHFTNSMHVYDRHYDMIRKILIQGESAYRHVRIPDPTREEVVALVQSKGKEGAGDYVSWLTADN